MKKKNTKHGKKSTQRGAVDFFLKVDGGELEKPKPIAIWKATPPSPQPPAFVKQMPLQNLTKSLIFQT